MFDCFTKLANKGNYNYETSYHDYSSSTNDYTNDEVNKNNEDNEDDEDQIILKANKVHNIKINLAFLVYYLFIIFNWWRFLINNFYLFIFFYLLKINL